MGDFIKDSGVNKWVNVFGDVQVIQNIERLKNGIQRKVLKKAIAKALKPIAAKAKQKVSKDTGLLASAIKTKVTRMISGKVYVDPNVIQATKDGETRNVKFSGKAKKGQGKKAFFAFAKRNGYELKIPAKYAHLVEFGTRKAKAKPFMRPARDESRNEALKEIENECRNGIEKLKQEMK
jgi:HK97 gp10 family phage protein